MNREIQEQRVSETDRHKEIKTNKNCQGGEQRETERKTEEQVEEENEANRSGYWSIVKHRFGINQFFQSTLIYAICPIVLKIWVDVLL